MTQAEAAAIEMAIAKIVKVLRDEHAAAIEPLQARVVALERDLAAFEARAGDPEARGTTVTWLQQQRGRR
jgi:hypothetical protein